MSAYLSFYKNKEASEDQHLLTVCRIVPMVQYFTDEIQGLGYEKPVILTEEALENIFKEVTKEINEQKESLAILLIKREYEEDMFKYHIEEYEKALVALGMIKIIAEMKADNNHALYLTYG